MPKQIIHSTLYENKRSGETAIHAVFKDTETNESTLKTFVNPTMDVWVTKPQYRRGQNTKIYCEEEDRCDVINTTTVDLPGKLQKALYPRMRKPMFLGGLLKSPFVYGADIDIDVRAKQHYLSLSEERPSVYRVSGMDIETSVHDRKPGARDLEYGCCIINSYCTAEGHVYQAILEEWLDGDGTIADIEAEFNKAIEDFRANCNKETKEIMAEMDFKLHVRICKSEVELYKWSMSMMHADKADYCSIWNINFDIKQIKERASKHGVPMSDIFCHPDIPQHLRVCNYKEDDNKNVQHLTHQWHVFECSGYTQFYDSMNGYSRLRKHKGVMDSYALDEVSKKIVGNGKVNIKDYGHYIMQQEHKVFYAAYGGLDAVLNVLIEKRINDVPSMSVLLEYSHIRDFAHQTAMLKHRFFAFCRENGKVSASQKGSIRHKTDDLIANVGGNVLPPRMARDAGSQKVSGIKSFFKGIQSRVMMCVNDLDVTSEYPSIAQAGNIAKDTKIMTVLGIQGFRREDILDFFGHVITPLENAVYLCSKFLKLPNYVEMHRLWKEFEATGELPPAPEKEIKEAA